MNPLIRSEATVGYESALEHLRCELVPTLRALELLAADPGAHDELEEELPHLQYALHIAAERALGIEPLAGLEEAHEELQIALAIAREETAQVTEIVEDAGPAAAEAFVWEWRGALFGVRLALQRLGAMRPAALPQPAGRGAVLPVFVLVLGVLGVLGVLAGALVSLWPVWAAGLVLVTISAAGSNRP
ncbi:MAG: hypothetical protein WKF65_04305 [Gaiellaceae bacterium]